MSSRSFLGSSIRRQITRGACILVACILVACVGVIVYVARKPGPTPPPPPPPPVVIDAPPYIDKAKFFDSDVQPAITFATKANHEAADRCIQRLKDMFAKHREGIKPFVEDLTSWGTRFGILRRMPSDWWHKDTKVQEMITAKFEEHLFSAKSLQDGIDDAVKGFRTDIEANNNQLLTNVNAAVSRRNLPDLAKIEMADFSSSVTKSIEKFATDSAVDSVTKFIITEIASTVGTEAATSLTTAIAERIAAAVAATAATEGGATAGGAAIGGGGGSAAGPAGTAVGLGVGIVVGVAIDWWMTSSFKEKLSGQLSGMIDETEKSLIDGADSQPGLRVSLDKSCDALGNAYRQSLYDRIVTGAK